MSVIVDGRESDLTYSDLAELLKRRPDGRAAGWWLWARLRTPQYSITSVEVESDVVWIHGLIQPDDITVSDEVPLVERSLTDLRHAFTCRLGDGSLVVLSEGVIDEEPAPAVPVASGRGEEGLTHG